jgi:hypothetical protein
VGPGGLGKELVLIMSHGKVVGVRVCNGEIDGRLGA